MVLIASFCFLLRGVSSISPFSTKFRLLLGVFISTFRGIYSFMVLFFYMIFAMSVMHVVVMRTDPHYEEKMNSIGFTHSFREMYRQTFGENVEEDVPLSQFVVYILSTLFLNVVTLNLLISIISDTYDRVTMTQQATDSKQKLELLLQIELMMKWNQGRKNKRPAKGKSSAKFYKEQKKQKDPRFLHILSYAQDDDAVNDGGEMWEGKIRILRKSINEV